jgi:hypothetical protein
LPLSVLYCHLLLLLLLFVPIRLHWTSNRDSSLQLWQFPKASMATRKPQSMACGPA